MRRIPIRVKLAAALAVPLIAMGVVTYLEVASVADEAREVREQTDLATATIGPNGLITALQNERNWASAQLVGADVPAERGRGPGPAGRLAHRGTAGLPRPHRRTGPHRASPERSPAVAGGRPRRPLAGRPAPARPRGRRRPAAPGSPRPRRPDARDRPAQRPPDTVRRTSRHAAGPAGGPAGPGRVARRRTDRRDGARCRGLRVPVELHGGRAAGARRGARSWRGTRRLTAGLACGPDGRATIVSE
jgi:hypothetical protein